MKLLITGAWSQAKEYIPQIESMGHQVLFLQQEKDSLPCEPEWVEGVICNGLFLHHPIEIFPNLKYIQLTSAGTDRVDTVYIKTHNIELHTARGVYSIPMAESALAGVLSLYRGLPGFQKNQQTHTWEKIRNLRELNGQTVLILGCGSVGTECAKRFKALGCKVLGIDLFPREDENFDIIFPLTELDNLLPQGNIILLTLPLTEGTRGLINQNRLNRIHGILVNIARGAIIDIKALESWGGEAILDVFEEEPLPQNSPFWSKENFIIMPHNSFVSNETADRLSKTIVNFLQNELIGKNR